MEANIYLEHSSHKALVGMQEQVKKVLLGGRAEEIRYKGLFLDAPPMKKKQKMRKIGKLSAKAMKRRKFRDLVNVGVTDKLNFLEIGEKLHRKWLEFFGTKNEKKEKRDFQAGKKI